MIGGYNTPFRPICGGAARFFLGLPFQHRRPGDVPVDAFGNSTEMLDHCLNTIGAKSLDYQQDACGENLCIGGECSECPGGFDLVINTPRPPAISANTWEQVGTVDLIPQRKLGFKNVQAFKWWHGRFGLLHHPDTGYDCDNTVLSNTKYLTITRELTMNWTVGFFGPPPGDPCGPGPFRADGTLHYKAVFTVDKDTGIITQVSQIKSVVLTAPGDEGEVFGGYDPNTLFVLDGACSDWQDFIDANTAAVTAAIVAGYTASSSGSISDTAFSAGISIYKDFTFGISPNTEVVPVGADYELSITLSDPYAMETVKSDTEAQSNEWSLTDDKQYPFRTDEHTTIGPLVLRNERTTTVSPDAKFLGTVDDYRLPITDGNTNAPFSLSTDGGQSGAAITDVNGNLPHSHAGDVGQSPASGGDPCTPVDWVPTYDPTPVDWVGTWEQMTWFDPASYEWVFPPGETQATAAATDLVALFDGAIIGAPLPAGYGQPVGGHPRGVFDRDHENWYQRFCEGDIPHWAQAHESRGSFTPSYLPANAPKWTDDLIATTLYPCAFVTANTEGVYLQKWSEIQIPRPSINFDRPYGPDKFLIDEDYDKVYFVSAYDPDTGTVTLKTIDFGTPSSLPFDFGDIVGGQIIGGFYNVAGVGTDTVVLGSKRFDIPTGWNTPSGDGASVFGKLRFPTAHGMDFLNQGYEIGGRVAITVTNESPVRITTATVQKYLSIITPEHIDIFDGSMNLLAANVAATRVDDNNFTVPTGFGTMFSAAWIAPAGKDYKFGDSRPKGDYVFRSWTIKLAGLVTLSQTQTDYCMSFAPCGPSVAVITPNGEAPANGNTHDFPAGINNGELWLGRAQFWMQDPFYQVPHKPVLGHDDLTDEDLDPDNGDIIIWKRTVCEEDFMEIGEALERIFHKFYPIEPYVEARCSIPIITGDFPPDLATGLDLTAPILPPDQASLANVAGPLVNAITLPEMFWGIFLREQGCVDANGRFANVYINNATPPSTVVPG